VGKTIEYVIVLLLLMTPVRPLFGQDPHKPATQSHPDAKGTTTNDPDPSSGEDPPCPQGRNQTAEARFGEYVIRTYRWPGPEGCLQILRHKRLVYSLESTEFKIGGNFEGGVNIPVGKDITGAGKPNAIVGEWSGGAHCCFTLHVFELGPRFREIAQIKAENSDGANFADLDHDGFYEFDGHDWAFAYWRTSFAFSPAPRIVLKYHEGGFGLALDLMSTPSPSSGEFAALVQRVRSDDDWWSGAEQKNCDDGCGVPTSLWKNMLELMYAGHADLAWKLFDESWPAHQKGKSTFAGAFCKQLSSSHYWSELKTAIGPCPPVPTP
jgi:hypothetical protein